jgi:hypothetical protein
MCVTSNFFRTLGLIAIFCFANSSSFAKVFQTQFIKIDLPPNWSCNQEEIDWVCQPDDLASRSEAIIVIVTKAVNEVDDNLPQYEKVLNVSRDMRDLLGNAYKSQVRYTRQKAINGIAWMDSLHLGSEIPGFYTRYVAGIKEKVAGLLTYSVAESVYPKYAPLLDQMVNSLELRYDPKAFAEAMNAGPNSLFGSRSQSRGGRGAPVTQDSAATEQKPEEDNSQLIGILILIAVAAFYIYKKKKG